MARFLFSMQNILDIKEKLEEQEKNNYSQANLRLREAEEKLEAIKARLAAAEEQLRREVSRIQSVPEIRRKEDGVEILKMYVAEQVLVVRAREKELEEARERLNEAMKERKTFEKLREKAFEKFVEEENRKEQKEVDELVSYRYGVAEKR